MTPLTTGTFKVRGYVRLRLPPQFRLINTPIGGIRFVCAAQSEAPVKIMPTPQNRAVCYDRTTGALSDQTQSSLPTASGAAVNNLPPDQPFVFPLEMGRLVLPVLARMQALVPPEDRGTMMATMLVSRDSDKTDLVAMNASLAEAGIGLALERRKTKK